jgi:hypothetical protein
MKSDNVQFERLPISAPPIFSEAVGYRGDARFVAFYWTPCGDDVICTDGTVRAHGNWYAWLLFVHHSAVALHLEPYDFGSSESEPTHWLLVDRQSNELYAGTPKEICKLLEKQSTGQRSSVDMKKPVSSGVITIDTFAAFLKEGLTEVDSLSQQEIKNEMRRRNKLIDELIRWLNYQETKPAN